MLWRQWERLYLVGGVLHRWFHVLEGQGWRPQLVVPADRHSIILQRFAKETTGTTRTTGAATSIHRPGPDGTLCNGRGGALPHHLDGEPILPHGGVLFLGMA